MLPRSILLSLLPFLPNLTTALPTAAPVPATCSAPLIRNGNFTTVLDPLNDWTLTPVLSAWGTETTTLFAGSTTCSDPILCRNITIPDATPGATAFLVAAHTRTVLPREDPTCKDRYRGCVPYFDYRLTQGLDFSSCDKPGPKQVVVSVKAASRESADLGTCSITIMGSEGEGYVNKNFEEVGALKWQEVVLGPVLVKEDAMEVNVWATCSEVYDEGRPELERETRGWVMITDVKAEVVG